MLCIQDYNTIHFGAQISLSHSHLEALQHLVGGTKNIQRPTCALAACSSLILVPTSCRAWLLRRNGLNRQIDHDNQLRLDWSGVQSCWTSWAFVARGLVHAWCTNFVYASLLRNEPFTSRDTGRLRWLKQPGIHLNPLESYGILKSLYHRPSKTIWF